jgi:hypothetical protein
VNIGQNTPGSNSHTPEQFVQLLVVLNGESQVTGHDTALLVVAGGVAGELEDFGAEVFEDGGEVDGGSGSHAGGVFALTEVTS